MKKYLPLVFIFISFQLASQIVLKEWEGKWSGTVKTYRYNNQLDSFAMSIEITPRDTIWDYVIFYDKIKPDGNPDIRNYQLVIKDESKYHLAVDEKNSIVLDSYINDNCFYSKFWVMGSDLQMRMCVNQDKMDYEITSYPSEPLRVSGNEVVQGDTIPEVRSYDLRFLMKAELMKEK